MTDDGQMSHEPAQNSTHSPDRGSRALPDVTDAGEALVQQIAEAIWASQPEWARDRTVPEDLADTARAVLPLVEAQVAPLRDEVATLREVLRIGTELDNHHNAATCPYCKPSEQDAAESALRQVRELAALMQPAVIVSISEMPIVYEKVRKGLAEVVGRG